MKFWVKIDLYPKLAEYYNLPANIYNKFILYSPNPSDACVTKSARKNILIFDNCHGVSDCLSVHSNASRYTFDDDATVSLLVIPIITTH